VGSELKKAFRITRRKLGGWVLPALGPSLVGALARSWRAEVLHPERLEEAARSRGHMMALWHGRMLAGMPLHRDRDYAVLVSPSDDGSLVARMLERYGYRVVRGSSSRSGARALRELLSVLRRGGTVVITPDGPRGPEHSMNAGLAWMARETGLPILPCGFACDRAWSLSSWDSFTVPKMGARVVVAYGEPQRVSAELDDGDLAGPTEAIRASLLAAEAEACAWLAQESGAREP